MLRKIVFLAFMLSCILGLAMAGSVQAAIINNGDFETCDLSGWNSAGAVGIDGFPWMISGFCSGFVNTQGIGDVCSWLYSDDVWPNNWPKSVTVRFFVRYSTTEPIVPNQVEDPFHAMLKFDDGNGDVTMVTVSANAVSAGPGFKVQDYITGTFLPLRSNPPWASVAFLGWDYTSHVLQVSGTIPYTNCDPVNIRFDICNSIDAIVPSYAQVDDVDITFNDALVGASAVKGGGFPIPCP